MSKPKTSSKSKPKSSIGSTTAAGGELHQLSQTTLTTDQGIPISDDQNSLRAGVRGPTLLEDFVLREKITHFDHERIPERIVHARGSGAHGYFELDASLSQYTRAQFCSSKRAPERRFSRAFQRLHGALARSTCRATCAASAVKFYTQRGATSTLFQQHPSLLHPRRNEVPRLDPCRKNGARSRLPAGGQRARYVLGSLHLLDAREHPHDHVGYAGLRHPALAAHDGYFGIHSFRLVDAKRQPPRS